MCLFLNTHIHTHKKLYNFVLLVCNWVLCEWQCHRGGVLHVDHDQRGRCQPTMGKRGTRYILLQALKKKCNSGVPLLMWNIITLVTSRASDWLHHKYKTSDYNYRTSFASNVACA